MRSLATQKIGETGKIRHLRGGDACRGLEEMGLVAGETVVVVSREHGGSIIEHNGARLAINDDAAERIIVE